jgi:hypothetical protein
VRCLFFREVEAALMQFSQTKSTRSRAVVKVMSRIIAATVAQKMDES